MVNLGTPTTVYRTWMANPQAIRREVIFGTSASLRHPSRATDPNNKPFDKHEWCDHDGCRCWYEKTTYQRHVKAYHTPGQLCGWPVEGAEHTVCTVGPFRDAATERMHRQNCHHIFVRGETGWERRDSEDAAWLCHYSSTLLTRCLREDVFELNAIRRRVQDEYHDLRMKGKAVSGLPQGLSMLEGEEPIPDEACTSSMTRGDLVAEVIQVRGRKRQWRAGMEWAAKMMAQRGETSLAVPVFELYDNA
ncbi:hypothetical protein QBC43DRAFT_292178 [Cladorrhinum sp. PSN259]|nr:hypothetical protein QBC43DRAFT_292178 [Cladorrhinum sp. PSN259]